MHIQRKYSLPEQKELDLQIYMSHEHMRNKKFSTNRKRVEGHFAFQLSKHGAIGAELVIESVILDGPEEKFWDVVQVPYYVYLVSEPAEPRGASIQLLISSVNRLKKVTQEPRFQSKCDRLQDYLLTGRELCRGYFDAGEQGTSYAPFVTNFFEQAITEFENICTEYHIWITW